MVETHITSVMWVCVEHLLSKLLQTVWYDKEHFFVRVKAYVTNCTQGNYIHAWF